jgi:glutamate-1-semialdehyde aminotransferase
MAHRRSEQLFEEAMTVIPGGIPGIRAPENFVRGAYPVLLASGHGGRVRDVDDHEYVDLLLGYGPVILGHADPRVDAAAAGRAADGFCLNLPTPLIVDLARKLVSLIPCAEQALFFKTGSDATSAAVRLARAHTGRTRILRCGYHGWHDWCLAGDPGVSPAVGGEVLAFRYNDADELGTLLERHAGEVAGIVITPIGHDFDRQIEAPRPGFLERVRALADHHGCVLIFDEVRTGFRVHLGGAQARYGVTPDLTALGKALSNGYPITAVVGRRGIMANAARTFMSSTYFPNAMEMAAALATLAVLEQDRVPQAIAQAGLALHGELERIVAETGLPVTLSPYPEMPFVYFDPTLASHQDERRDRFYAALIDAGVFAHPRHHGFLCARHDREDLARVAEAVREAARRL